MLEESKIFKNEQALSTEYLPEFLPHRETQIELIAKNISPASKGRSVQNMFIIGSPGIGKTASVRFVFRQFEEFSERVKTIYINTWNYNTSVAILSKIVLDIGMFVQRRGMSKDEIMEKLIEALKKSNKGLIICLDEVDQLIKKDEGAMYDLLRLNQYVDNPIGLVMISNYRDIFVNVEPRIKSSLNIEELEFKPYTIQEMKNILTERVKNAFRLGSLEDGVILLCANHAINKGGDVRIGLECLRKAARICEEENSDKIKTDYVKAVLKETGPVKLKIMQEQLQGVEKNLVDLLSKEEEITSTDLHNKYVKNFGDISQFGLTKHVKHLEDIGIIKVKESRTETRGRKWFISLVKRKVFK
ncbi:MAG: AAA family ATPase [Candidatus Aenigmarchaeota archaeon]|nr:AAA family ATPase [Candidatus Aenigmarchaeota archaeon]